MNKLLILIVLLLCNLNFAYCSSAQDSMIIEKIVFQSTDTNRVHGTLYLPDNGVQRIVIELVSMDKPFRHPDFSLNSDTVYYNKIRKMTKNNTGVFLVSPRLQKDVSPMDKNFMKSRLLLTPETLADDALYAFNYLKTDKRFEGVKIGVMGTSATGVSAAMAAARNSGIAFVILNSTPSTKSVDEADYMWNKNRVATIFYKALFSELWTIFDDSTFVYNGKVYQASNAKPIKEQFQSCAWDCMSRINREVLLKNDNSDTIRFYARKMFKESLEGNNLSKAKRFRKFGKDEEVTIDQYIDIIIDFWYTPQDISYLKWNPENYYPKIKCPVLMVFGDKDIQIDFEGSLNNSRNIVNHYNKKNYSIEVLNGVGHNFTDRNILVKEKNGVSKNLKVIQDSYYEKLIKWLNSIPG